MSCDGTPQREVHATVQPQHLSTQPTWNGAGVNGHDGFTWEGDRFAIGQHIGGHFVWSSRFELAYLYANPGTPLFLVRDDGTIAFQAMEAIPGEEGYCYGVDVQHILDELEGMDVTDFMTLLGERRGDGEAVAEERLREIRQRGENSGARFEDDIVANNFYPICTPEDAVYCPTHRPECRPPDP